MNGELSRRDERIAIQRFFAEFMRIFCIYGLNGLNGLNGHKTAKNTAFFFVFLI